MPNSQRSSWASRATCRPSENLSASTFPATSAGVPRLFLLGESYGTTRAAGLAGYLADHGIAFNGVTLLSMAVDFQTLEWNKSNDMPYFLLVPTFNMIAGYHHKLAADLTQDMAKTRDEVMRWSLNDYASRTRQG